jgi:hypothetical protein
MWTNKCINRFFRLCAVVAAIVAGAFTSGCDADDPTREDTPELITKATLTFTPASGGPAVVVTAIDPDGLGVQNMIVSGPVILVPSENYVLTIDLINELAQPNDPAYDIGEEVAEEGDEHLFFFSWTNNVFRDPAGDGNIDNRADDVNYLDEDSNAFPLGLQTSWVAGGVSSGALRVVLKHQPELKSATSTSLMGETDLDLQFAVTIQ